MGREQLNTARYSVPLYREDARYAKEHSEIDLFRASHKANIACRDAIDAAIQEHFDGMRLSKDAARDVLAEFGPERVSHVLAATLLDKLHDQRISDANMAWARSVPMFDTGNRHYDYAINSHSVKLDGFVTLARKRRSRRSVPSRNSWRRSPFLTTGPRISPATAAPGRGGQR